MRNSSLIISLAAAAALLAGASAFGETVYKWKDAQGQSHYTQQQPEGVKYETITAAGNTMSDSADASQVASDAADQKSGGDSSGGQTPAQQQRQQMCTSARANADLLTKNATVHTDLNGDGKQVTLNAAQHDQALADANKQVDLYCAK